MGAFSLFLIAVGGIMAFAVADRIEGVDLATAGFIFMIVGGIGLVFSVIAGWGFTRFRSHTERTVTPDGRTVIEDRRTTGV